MMMETANEIMKAPEKELVIMEDLCEEEQVVAMGHSSGLYNLGNSCYMNSTVQCLFLVPKLKSALLHYSRWVGAMILIRILICWLWQQELYLLSLINMSSQWHHSNSE
ncbi:hypothetical protein Nepgr_026277 [Nepenthes gracilis]|uniref:ubiquitinyl hydrolase 1 n=1 Tax=Nepenthes gracilis TaxID=150966 RepID=A0AAD3Y1X3_NEPGR|nr:hypothetical protein Nepgr_026277 [Nepenthes gracilis]